MAKPKAIFLTGGLMRHIIVMSASSSIGLISIFLVEFVDLLFISMLGSQELTAAVGFAATILFFTFSTSVGLMIACGALAARRIGQGDPEEARMIASSVIVFGASISVFIALLGWMAAPHLMALVGAKGDTATYAVDYFRIVVLSMPISSIAVMSSGLLRAHGDARRAMTVTLVAGAVNAALDPIFIFGLGLGLEGAAYASVSARIAMMIAALYPVFRHYGGLEVPKLARMKADVAPILAIAGPAILTNIATPFGNGFVTRLVSDFGDSAVAAWAVMGRLAPLAFCAIFALSGAVGPIIGQNFGALNYDRVRGTLTKSVQFICLYILAAWALLILIHPLVSSSFSLDEQGANLVFWFAVVVTPLFMFNGILFVSNAAFNNLQRPIFSTLLNWGRNTLGVIPLAFLGAHLGGAVGVLVGQALGAVVFGLLGLWLAFRLTDAYESGRSNPDKRVKFYWSKDDPKPTPIPPR